MKSHSFFANVRGGRTLRIAAAGSALAATAAIGGLSVAASADPAPSDEAVTVDYGPVTGTDQSIDDSSDDLADDNEATPDSNAGGSPTGLEHSQRWHAAAAHASQPPSFAASDSSDETSTSSDDSTESEDSTEPQDSTESSDDQSDDSTEHADDQGEDSTDESSDDSTDQSQSDDSGDDSGDQYGDQGDDGGEHDD